MKVYPVLLQVFASFFFAVLMAQAIAQGHRPNGAVHVGSGPGMYSHISDAEEAIGPNRSGVVILESGYTDTITSTLKIGVTKTYGIKLIMEPGSQINENIMNGSPGIVILDGSAMECMGAAPSGTIGGQAHSTCMVYTDSDAVDVSAMVASQTILDGSWQDVFGLQGITFVAGGAKVGSVIDLGATGAPSYIVANTFYGEGNTTYVVHIHNNVGGGVIWMDNQVRGANAVTGALYYITGDETTGFQGVTGSFTIEGGEASCTGPNAPAMIIDGNPNNRTGNWQGVMHLNVHALWSQTCEGVNGYPPAYVIIKDASYVHFYDQQFSSHSPTLFYITESNPEQVNNLLFDNITMSCTEVNCVGQNFAVDKTKYGFLHHAPSWTNNAQLYGQEGFVMHDEAGRWTYTPGPSIAGTTTLNQLDAYSLNIADSATSGSASRQDASTGYAWRVGNGGAINLDFGGNNYVNSWIESYQNGTTVGKPLFINTKYHAPTYFGGTIGIWGVGDLIDSSGNLFAGAGTVPIYRCTGSTNNGVLTANPLSSCASVAVDTGLRTK